MEISGKEKNEYLLEDMIIPLESDLKYKIWRRDNTMVKTWLLCSPNPEIGENFLLGPTTQREENCT